MTDADEFRHMWDGSEPGWRLRQTECEMWQLTIEFADEGPTLSQVAAVRRLVDEFRDAPTSVVLQCLRGHRSYTLLHELGNIELRNLIDTAERSGLPVTAEAIDRGGYLPISPKGHACIIEDDGVAEQVVRNMLGAGVPVVHFHVD